MKGLRRRTRAQPLVAMISITTTSPNRSFSRSGKLKSSRNWVRAIVN